MPDVIHVVAAVIRDQNGRMLLVRKKNTAHFMQPGGKPEPHEEPLVTLDRELAEELACTCDLSTAIFIGRFRAPSANEPGCHVQADVYDVTICDVPKPQAEIEEIFWYDIGSPADILLAPLTRDAIIPLLRRDDANSKYPSQSME
jgi:8-oxo-dGTP pyrophosphatase MutT (NUDIX family)